MGKIIPWPEDGAQGCDPREAEILKEVYTCLVKDRVGRRVQPQNWLMAYGTIAAKLFGISSVSITAAQAEDQVRKFLERLLLDGKYLQAATLMWGGHYFYTEPRFIRDVFATVQQSSVMIALGGSSTSKTYGLAAYLYLDWRLDPAYTSIKVIGPNEQHMRTNVFAQLRDLHSYASIPLDAKVVNLCIALPTNDDAGVDMEEETSSAAGIMGILVPKSLDGASRVKGYKARPRPFGAHPKFGELGRLRILVDEGQDAPDGMWEDFGSIIAGINNTETIKIMVAGNPTKRNCKMVEYAEPDRGWREGDVDTLKRWVSKKGWDVIRCDGMDSENVKQQKEVYRGLVTYEGMKRIEQDGSPAKWWGNFRGWPPMASNAEVIFQPQWLDRSRGEPNFDSEVEWVASIDPSFEGDDNAAVCIGRYGVASSFRNIDGEEKPFLTHDNATKALESGAQPIAEPRRVLCVDTIMFLSDKGDPLLAAEETKKILEQMGIRPENTIVDAGGNASGFLAHLRRIFGPEVHGIMSQYKATEMPISADDATPASKLYTWIVDEMWFTTATWIRSGLIKISPSVPTNPLWHQLTTRRYKKTEMGKFKVEQKKEWKNRNSNRSPDEADALMMLTQLVRMRFGKLPSVVEAAEQFQGVNVGPDGFLRVKPQLTPPDKWAIFRTKMQTRDVLLDGQDDALMADLSTEHQHTHED